MSRTLIHRPRRAWFHDRAQCIEVHDHDDEPCDLPDFQTLDDWVAHHGFFNPWDEWPWNCGWDLADRWRPNRCGCRICTDHYWRREDRRRDRHDTRRWLRTGRWLDEWID